MTDTRNEAAHLRLRIIAPTVPYLAVLIGLYAMSSAWVSILLYHAGMVLILAATKGWTALRMPPEKACRKLLLVMAAGAALLGPLIYAAWSTVRLSNLELTAELTDLGLVDLRWALFVVYYFTVNPLLEEEFWRGYLGSNATGLALNDGLFAGYHVLVVVKFVSLPWVATSFLGLLAAAWTWRQVARRCSGLMIPCVSHGSADASLILAAVFLA